jgi:hypothetical protein
MPDSPHLTPAKRREQAARSERLARALRDNLHRRKAQARTREEGGPAKKSEGEPPA